MTAGIDMWELLKPILDVLWSQVAGPACLILLGGIAIMVIIYLIRHRTGK